MSRVKFKATEQQLRQLAANAVNASKPMGTGHYSYNSDHRFTPEDFKVTPGRYAISLDYVAGRMVKLQVWHEDGFYFINEVARPDYQSWCRSYPSGAALLESVGIVGVPVVESKHV